MRPLAAALVFFLLAAGSAAWAATIPEPSLAESEDLVGEKVRELRDLLAAEPLDAERWGRYGMVLEAHGFSDDARAAYTQANVLDSEEVRWVYYLAATFDSSAPQRAVDLYLRSIELDPAYAPAHVRVAQTLEKLARYDEARRHYERTTDLDRDNPFGPLGLGRIALRAGDSKAALRYLERAYRLSPEIHATVSALAQAYHRDGG